MPAGLRPAQAFACFALTLRGRANGMGGMNFNMGFSRYSVDDLCGLSDKVRPALDAKAGVFNSLPVSTATLATLTANLRSADASSGSGRTQAVKTAFNALADALTKVAQYVQDHPTASETDKASIPFPRAQKAVRTSTAPRQVQNVRLAHGDNQTEVIVRCKAMTAGNVRHYQVQWTLDVNSEQWNEGGVFTSTQRMKMTGLPRGKDIWVRVRAFSAGGYGEWSDPATIMVT